ncbi:hypothetical protein [Lysobacter gummosus]|uniref:hypothetical protein n=1 Tax=Lysobacter gummosus TaxID=262324 RepID=UPI0036413D14
MAEGKYPDFLCLARENAVLRPARIAFLVRAARNTQAGPAAKTVSPGSAFVSLGERAQDLFALQRGIARRHRRSTATEKIKTPGARPGAWGSLRRESAAKAGPRQFAAQVALLSMRSCS